MSTSGLWMIELTFKVLAGLFALLIALLMYWETAEGSSHERTRDWFKQKWIAISSSFWLTLPERIVVWLLGVKSLLANSLIEFFFTRFYDHHHLALISVLLFHLGCWFHFRLTGLITAFGISVPALVFIGQMFGIKIPLWMRGLVYEFFTEKLFFVYLLFLYGVTAVLWTSIILGASLYFATFMMVVLLPIYGFLLFSSLAFLYHYIISRSPSEQVEVQIFLFCMGTSASFTLTFLAFLFGNFASPRQNWASPQGRKDRR